MSDRVETYDVDDAPAIEIANNAGDIVIKEGTAGKAKISLSGSPDAVEGAAIEVSSDLITITSRPPKARFFSKRVDIVVVAPPGGVLKIELGSGAVRVRLPMTDVAISSASGEVRVDKPVRDLSIKVASGEVRVDRVERQATINSANGNIRIASANDLTINTASGDVRVGEVFEVARIKSASGDVVVGMFGGSELEIKTLSGDSRIGLVPGMEVKARVKTLSGDIRNKITPTPGPRVGSMSLNVTSFSGDITLKTSGTRPAEPPEAPEPPEPVEPPEAPEPQP
jgi:hypothetical protein